METAASPARVVVVGGYGMFGARVAERLARTRAIRVVVAGRSEEKAREAAGVLASSSGAQVDYAAINAAKPDAGVLARLQPRVVINASGPFQAQDYSLARAAIVAGSHYVDLADARQFVIGIGRLDEEAKAAGVLVTSGASSVPALAAAIIDAELVHFGVLEEIEHGITPANGYDPGEATTASILGGLGQPVQVWRDGKWQTGRGWQGLERVAIEGLGHRWMALCDVPDLSLFPQRYPAVRTVVFKAGLDVPIFQLSLRCLAGLARRGLIRRPDKWAPVLVRIKRQLRFLGGDAGGMIVRLCGRARDGSLLKRTVVLAVRENQGPHVPAIASAVITRKLVEGALRVTGALPCVGLMSREEFEQEVRDLPLTITSRTA